MTISEFYDYFEIESRLSDMNFFPLKRREENNLLRYYRKSNDRIDLLGITFFSENRFQEKGIFIGYDSITSGIYFSIINEIFEKAKIEILRPHWYNECEYYNGEKVLSFKHPNWQKPINKYPTISKNLLNDNNDLDEFLAEEACQILREIINDQIFPFYKMYPNLQAVNDEIIDCFEEPRDLMAYISGIMPFKKIVIMHLCGNYKYNEYIKGYEKQLRSAISINKEKYGPTYQFFTNLIEILEHWGK